MSVSLLVAVYLLQFNPLESPFANRIELMNECTIVVLTYGLMHFSDFMLEPEDRNMAGYIYMAIVLTNIAVHLIILIRDTCIKAKFVCRRCSNWCNRRRSRRQDVQIQIAALPARAPVVTLQEMVEDYRNPEQSSIQSEICS